MDIKIEISIAMISIWILILISTMDVSISMVDIRLLDQYIRSNGSYHSIKMV